MSGLANGLGLRRTRRYFFTRGALTLAGAAGLSGVKSLADTGKQETVEVDTANGRLRGLREEGLCTFRGIAYAGPVSGANRFKAAPALQTWSGVRDALQFAAPSLQPGRQARGSGLHLRKIVSF